MATIPKLEGASPQGRIMGPFRPQTEQLGPARSVAQPVQPVAAPKSTQPTSTILQRAMSGEFGDTIKQMATAKNAPQEVDATAIGTASMSVPPAKVPSIPSSPIAATIAATVPTTPDTEDVAVSPRDQAIQNYMQMLSTGFDTSQETKDLQTAAADAKLVLDNLNTRMTEYEKETRDTEYAMLQNPEGKLAGALQAEVNNYKYERYAKKDGLADMAIAAQFALNNANFAYEIANNAVTAEKERYTSQMQGFRDLYTMLQNDMTESEQMQYASQLRMYESAVNDYTASKNAAMQRAQANGAPQEVVMAIKNAQSTEEVWASAGQYGIDPNLSLARDKHGWDVWYGQQQLAMNEKKLAFDQWLAGQSLSQKEAEAQQQKFEKQMKDGETVASLLRDAGKTQQAVKEALANKSGLAGSTGAVRGWLGSAAGGALAGGLAGAATGAVTGPGALPLGIGGAAIGGIWSGVTSRTAREDFQNDIRLITSAQALTELGNLGISLAPITNYEINLVGSKASNLASSVSIDEETGEMTIRGSTKEFEKNLAALDEQLDKTITALSNDPNLQTYLLANDLQSIDALLGE